MKREKINLKIYLVVFLLTTIIFISGLLIGTTTSKQKIENIKNLQDVLKVDILDIEMQYKFFEHDPCSYVNITPLAEQLYEIGSRLSYMEDVLGKNNEKVIELKRYYSLLEMNNLIFEKKIKETCDRNTTLILFFYSNKGDCEDCDEQGFILTYLREKYGPKISIYSFDFNLELESLKFIKNKYKITQVPAIVIDEKTYNKFMTKEELEKIIFEDKDV